MVVFDLYGNDSKIHFIFKTDRNIQSRLYEALIENHFCSSEGALEASSWASIAAVDETYETDSFTISCYEE